MHVGVRGRSILSHRLKVFTSRFHVSEVPHVAAFRIRLPPFPPPFRNRPWHKSSEESHEIRQLPHIDLQSPDFLFIFGYCHFTTFHVMNYYPKVFLVRS